MDILNINGRGPGPGAIYRKFSSLIYQLTKSLTIRIFRLTVKFKTY